jgi:hypothetical protein
MARESTRSTRVGVLERVDALPAWLLVGGLVALSAIVRFILTRGYPSPWTWTDELLYAELAKTFGLTGHFAIREVPGRGGFGFVYPVLLSPAYALTSNVPAAYAVMKAINCVVMSLTVVPTYLIARRFVGRWLALAAALLVVAHPALTYTAGIMTENAFYPIFVFWCWAMLRMLETPTVMRQLGAIALLPLAYFTRPQAIMLLPALVSTLVLVTMFDAVTDRGRSFGRALLRAARPYLATWLIFAASASGFLVLEFVIRGKTWGEALLGPYSSLSAEHYSITKVSHWLVYHVGELAFSLEVIPFAALLLVVFAGLDPREPNRKLRLFALVALPAASWVLIGVAAFASTPYALRIEERNMMYLDPLFLVALVACIGGGLLWRRRTAAALAAVLAVACVGAVPFISYLGPSATNDAFSLLPLQSVLDRHIVAPTQLLTLIILGAVVAAGIFLLTPPRFGIALPAVVLLAFVLANGPVHRRTEFASTQALLGGIQAKRDWIDRAVGTKPEVAALWSGRAPYVTLWDNEFFNRSVGSVYNFNGPPDGLPQETVVLQPSGAVTYADRPIRAKYVLADPSMIVAGRPVARDEGLGMTVYRVDGPIKVSAELVGLFPDLWSGATVSYVQHGCTGGTVTVRLTSDPLSHPFPQTITATVGEKVYTKVVRPRHFNVPFVVPVVPDKDHICGVTYGVSPTAIPGATIKNGDTRALGIRFVRVVYRPPNGPAVSNR